jgi:GNAT superfamily N-acetyltransferase
VAVRIEQVAPERAFALRQAVLRPWLSVEEIAATDVAAPTFAAIEGDTVIGCATLLEEHAPGVVPEAARGLAGYRLRNMATEPGRRGEGIGAALLHELFTTIAAAGGGVLWCHARLVAVGFYERAGLVRAGDEFDIDPIGTHVVMWRVIEGA